MNWHTLLLLLATILLPGCNPSGMPNQAEEQAVKDPVALSPSYPAEIIETSAFYIGGPQQGRPPEGEFIKGTRVKVLENAGSYSVVRSEDGIEAYVSTGVISPASEKISD